MNILISVLISISFYYQEEQNPYIGTWESYDIKSFKDDFKIKNNEFSNFHSTITFNENLSFIKFTNGIKTIGKYEFTSNKFKFLEPDSSGIFHPSWSLRWPKKTNDPSPITKGIIDLNYPELFTIKDENGKDKFVDLDVYYKKLN